MRVGFMASSLDIFIHLSPPIASILFLSAHLISLILLMSTFTSHGEGINTLALPPSFLSYILPNTPSLPLIPSPFPFTFSHVIGTSDLLRDFADKYLPSPPPPQFLLFFSREQSFHALLFQSFPSISCSLVINAFNSLSDFAYKYPHHPPPTVFFILPTTAPILSFPSPPPLPIVGSISAFLFILIRRLYISFPYSFFLLLS